MGTLANSEVTYEMQHNAAFHLGLHCLLRLKRSLEKKVQFLLEIIPNMVISAGNPTGA